MKLSLLGAAILAGAVLASSVKAEPMLSHQSPLPDCNRYRDDDLYSLACTVYFEARGQSLKGQRAVAHVVMNRLHDGRFGHTIAEVVWQRVISKGHRKHAAFSWTNDGRSDRVTDGKAWTTAMQIALGTILVRSADPSRGAVFFQAKNLRHPGIMVAQIDGHAFFRENTRRH